MAKLSAFRVDSKAREMGEWIKPGDEFDDLEIHTRGFTDVYTDARAAKLRRVAMGFGGDERKIPAALVRSIVVEAMISHVLLDVRGLRDEHGKDVDFARFCLLLRDPDYSPLFDAAVRAASMVGLANMTEAQDAAGNSETPSA